MGTLPSSVVIHSEVASTPPPPSLPLHPNPNPYPSFSQAYLSAYGWNFGWHVFVIGPAVILAWTALWLALCFVVLQPWCFAFLREKPHELPDDLKNHLGKVPGKGSLFGILRAWLNLWKGALAFRHGAKGRGNRGVELKGVEKQRGQNGKHATPAAGETCTASGGGQSATVAVRSQLGNNEQGGEEGGNHSHDETAVTLEGLQASKQPADARQGEQKAMCGNSRQQGTDAVTALSAPTGTAKATATVAGGDTAMQETDHLAGGPSSTVIVRIESLQESSGRVGGDVDVDGGNNDDGDDVESGSAVVLLCPRFQPLLLTWQGISYR